MRRPSKPKIRTKERYILDSLETIFKGGHWVDEGLAQLAEPLVVIQDDVGSSPTSLSDRGGGVSAPENGSCGRTEAYLTVIGGQKYDGDSLDDYLSRLPRGHRICVGDGRGAETFIALQGDEDYALHVTRHRADTDRYGKSARKVNVEEVLCYAIDSPLLLVGSGERVKQAKAWLERTKSSREVIEIP